MAEVSKDEVLQAESAACCASFYEQDWVQNLLGESFHPGGIDLSMRLVDSLNLPSDARVLDVACGIGTTTLMMARQFCLDAVGLDFSQANLDKAIEAAGKSPAVLPEFFQASADNLPFDDDSFDGVVCECAVSTFTNQPQVIAEFARVLKPGGVVGITDMVIEGTLPDGVAKQVAPWTCLAEARTVRGYQQLFLDAGFTVTSYIDESNTLLELIAILKKKLLMAGVGKALGAMPGLQLEIADLRQLLQQAKELSSNGTVQYCHMVFSKGRPTFVAPQSELRPKAIEPCGCEDGTCC